MGGVKQNICGACEKFEGLCQNFGKQMQNYGNPIENLKVGGLSTPNPYSSFAHGASLHIKLSYGIS